MPAPPPRILFSQNGRFLYGVCKKCAHNHTTQPQDTYPKMTWPLRIAFLTARTQLASFSLRPGAGGRAIRAATPRGLPVTYPAPPPTTTVPSRAQIIPPNRARNPTPSRCPPLAVSEPLPPFRAFRTAQRGRLPQAPHPFPLTQRNHPPSPSQRTAHVEATKSAPTRAKLLPCNNTPPHTLVNVSAPPRPPFPPRRCPSHSRLPCTLTHAPSLRLPCTPLRHSLYDYPALPSRSKAKSRARALTRRPTNLYSSMRPLTHAS